MSNQPNNFSSAKKAREKLMYEIDQLPAGLDADSVKVEPLDSLEDMATYLAHCDAIAPMWVRVMAHLGFNTSHRPGDLCRLRWSSIDFETGELTVRVAKQTRSRATKARNKILRDERERMITHERESVMLQRADPARYFALSAMDIAAMEAAGEFSAEVIAHADAVHLDTLTKKAKIDVKPLGADLLQMLQDWRTQVGEDEVFVFPSTCTTSNRRDNLTAGAVIGGHEISGHVSRSSAYRWAKAIGAAVQPRAIGEVIEVAGRVIAPAKKLISRATRLSLYSWRKTSARILEIVDGLASAQKALGHSSPETTKLYTNQAARDKQHARGSAIRLEEALRTQMTGVEHG